MCSTCFRHKYIHHQELATVLLNYHIGSMCVGVSVWLGWSVIRVAGWTAWTKKNTTNVVIQQNSRKLLIMDIFMSETFWAHKKWNKIASDINLVFYSSTITMMHGPINIRYTEISLIFRSYETYGESCKIHSFFVSMQCSFMQRIFMVYACVRKNAKFCSKIQNRVFQCFTSFKIMHISALKVISSSYSITR